MTSSMSWHASDGGRGSGSGRSGECLEERAGGPSGHQAQSLAVAAQPRQPERRAIGEARRAALANAPLALVYLLKTALKEIWFAPSIRDGFRQWRDWYRMAIDSGLPAVILFARRLRRYLQGILASAIYPMNSEHPRRRQQPHQGHQAHGLRIPRLSLFLSEDQGGLPGKPR